MTLIVQALRPARFPGIFGGFAVSTMLLLGLVGPASARAAVSDYGIESVGASLSTRQAGAHPDFTTVINLKRDPATETTYASTKEVVVDPPLGLVGNATAASTCSITRFVASNLWYEGNPPCPQDSQVGMVKVELGASGLLREPLYNLPGGHGRVARLGFVGVAPIILDIEVRSDYGLTVAAHGVTELVPIRGIETTLWGVPADPSHDPQRITPEEVIICTAFGEPGTACLAPGGARSSGLAPVPFMTNPTHCGPQQVDFLLTAYQLPGQVFPDTASLPDASDCASVPFDPTMSLQPTTRRADAPSGLDIELKVPQEGLLYPNTLGSSHLKEAVVTLPQGVSLDPSAAAGLQGCSEAQVGLIPATDPPRFDGDEAACPDASKVGTVKIETPLLSESLEGALYVARQGENPFESLLAGYIVAKGEGVIIKQAVRFELDPNSGRIKAIVENAPQQPFSLLKMHVKDGARGVLQTPRSCGAYSSEYELTPWSGNPPVKGTSPFTIDEGCNGGGFDPKLSAGTTSPIGGAYSPFVFNVSREDGEQNVAALAVNLPKGLTAKLAGVPLCPEAETASGDCPAASQIGTVNAAVGSGSLPLWVPQPGKAPTAVYLAGLYKGAPYSIVAKVPAQAGPFDLGVVAVRSGIYVDPETAQVTVKSDPLPPILEGIPISYRQVHVEIGRGEFTLNPTSCEAAAVGSTITSNKGATASPSDRFQVGGCGELGFEPRLGLRLFGKTNRGAHPRLRAVLTMPKSGANIARAAVTLPGSEILDQGHLNNVCTRVQFAARKCPASSVIGHVKATTPLLDKPLEGLVYLGTGYGTKLPMLVADMKGQIEIVLRGRIDSVRGGIRTTFETVPDAPVSKFTLTMQGGRKGLLENSTDLCASTNRATVRFDSQNGKLHDLSPAVQSSCKR